MYCLFHYLAENVSCLSQGGAAIVDGGDIRRRRRVHVVAYLISQESLLSSLTFSRQLEKGSSGHREAKYCVGDEPIVCINGRSSEKPEDKGVSYSIVTFSGDIEKELLASDSSLWSDSLLFCSPQALARSK